jgi:drug/metabolite transporter (DMT)-like permease
MVAVYVLLCLVWGTTWAAIEVMLRGIPPFSGVAIRFFIAGTLLWAIARGRRVPLGRKPYERRLWWINAAFAFSISYGAVYWAEQWVPSGLAAVLFATYPLFVGAIAHFALPGERVSALEGVGMLIGFAGVVTIFSADFGRLGGTQVFVASIVMLASPISAAIGTVCVKRWGAGIHPLSLTAVPMMISGVAMGGVALVLERDRDFTFGAAPVLALLYLTIVGSAITFTLYYWLLEYLPAKRMALIAYLIPVIAIGIGTFRGEVLTSRVLAGSSVVIGGVALAIHFAGRARRRMAS